MDFLMKNAYLKWYEGLYIEYELSVIWSSMAIWSDEVFWFSKCPEDPRNILIKFSTFQEDLFIFNQVIFFAVMRDTIQSTPKLQINV